MKSLTLGPQAPLRTATPASRRGERAALIDRVAEAAVRKRLGGLAHGVLHLMDGDSSATFGARTASCPLEVTTIVSLNVTDQVVPGQPFTPIHAL